MNTTDSQKYLVTKVFNRVASSYGKNALFFQQFAEKMVPWVGVEEGDNVLDVATGRGALLPHILSAIGSKGKIIAIDLAEDMVSLTRKDIEQQGFPNVEVLQMDAESLQFEDNSFDRVFSGFAMHLLPYPDKAFSEINRVLKPGGIFGFSVSGPVSGNRWRFYDDLILKYDTYRDKSKGDIAPPPDFEKLLRTSGFTLVEKINIEVHLPVHDPDTFWEMEMSHGMRGFIDSLPEAIQKEFKAEVMTGLQKMHGDGGIVLDRGAWFYKGVKQ